MPFYGIFKWPAHTGFIKKAILRSLLLTVARWFFHLSQMSIHQSKQHLQLLRAQALKYVVTFKQAPLKGNFLHFIPVWEPINTMSKTQHKHSQRNSNVMLMGVKLSAAGEPICYNLTNTHNISLYCVVNFY